MDAGFKIKILVMLPSIERAMAAVWSGAETDPRVSTPTFRPFQKKKICQDLDRQYLQNMEQHVLILDITPDILTGGQFNLNCRNSSCFAAFACKVVYCTNNFHSGICGM